MSLHSVFLYRVTSVNGTIASLQFLECLHQSTSSSVTPSALQSPASFTCECQTLLVVSGDFRYDLLRVHPAPPTHITPIPTIPSAAPATLGQDFAKALKDQAVASKTPAGNGVGTAAAAVLSKRPADCLQTGMTKCFNWLYNCQPGDLFLLFWGITAWRIQLQPYQLLSLFKSWNSLSPDVFASLLDLYNDHDSLKHGLIFTVHTEKLDDTITVDTAILSRSIDAFKHAIHSYCAILDTIYILKDTIRDALRATSNRVIDLADKYRATASSRYTDTLFRYLLTYFFQKLNQTYMAVLGDQLTESGVIAAFALIPDTDGDSPFRIHLRQLHLDSSRDIVSIPATKRQRVDTPNNNPSASNVTLLAPSVSNSSPSHLAKIPVICGFYLSTAGCSHTAQACLRQHRAETPADKDVVVAFFKKFKNYVKK